MCIDLFVISILETRQVIEVLQNRKKIIKLFSRLDNFFLWSMEQDK